MSTATRIFASPLARRLAGQNNLHAVLLSGEFFMEDVADIQQGRGDVVTIIAT